MTAITPTHAICIAYESGYGHGWAGDSLVNPYVPGTSEREAYSIGCAAAAAKRATEDAIPPSQRNIRQRLAFMAQGIEAQNGFNMPEYQQLCRDADAGIERRDVLLKTARSIARWHLEDENLRGGVARWLCTEIDALNVDVPTPAPGGAVTDAASKQQLVEAAKAADWQQVILNGGPPCFHLEEERGRFCLRAQRWAGHGHETCHDFVPLDRLLAMIGESPDGYPVNEGD